MPEGETGTPTWKFTQYVSSLQQFLSYSQSSVKYLYRCRSVPGGFIVILLTQLKHLHYSLTDNSGLNCLLTCVPRCFGDKGDVEDITEGIASTSCNHTYLDFTASHYGYA